MSKTHLLSFALYLMLGSILSPAFFNDHSFAGSDEKELVLRFTAGMLAGNESTVMQLIHPDFSAEIGDRKAFEAWLKKWFEWDDDYVFEAENLTVKADKDKVLVGGRFKRAWLMGIHADDVDISQETELTEGLEEEGASVQKIERNEEITFVFKKEGGNWKIISISGMSMYDPMSAAVTSRDPRAKRIGQALSALAGIPLIGGIFSPNKEEFEKGKRGALLLAFVIGGALVLWIGFGVAKSQIQLAVLNAHAFPEGISYHTQYEALQEHLERVRVGSEEKRHDFYLRSLIDDGKFEEAKKYVEGMIVYCKKRKDKLSAETYASYRNRVDELHRRSLEIGRAQTYTPDLAESIHHERTELNVHKVLEDEGKTSSASHSAPKS